MKVLLQRVKKSSVIINGGEKREIGQGINLLVGISQDDTKKEAYILLGNVWDLEFLQMKMTNLIYQCKI